MEKIMPIILDVLLMVMVFWTVYSSAKKGFVAAAIDLIGYVAALIGARFISKFMANWIFEAILRPIAIDKVKGVLDEYFTLDQLVSELEKVVDELPAIVTNSINLEGEDIALRLQQTTGLGTDLVSGFTDAIVAPAIIGVMQVLIFIILFSLALYVVHLLSSLFQEMYRLPVIGTANSVLGGAIGLVEVILLVFAFTTLLQLFFVLTGDSVSWLNSDTVRASNILSKLYEYNPLLSK